MLLASWLFELYFTHAVVSAIYSRPFAVVRLGFSLSTRRGLELVTRSACFKKRPALAEKIRRGQRTPAPVYSILLELLG
jgi:hypothetical protein